jgi:hypothetical protein
MATATKKPSSPSPSSPQAQGASDSRPPLGRVLRVVDAVYRFLASLKLAVISLGTLAAVLAYATFFESWYGTAAVQEWIYRSKGFALLLAFLGTNILCAALIRYPWKKRQIGFLITHAGLLILLAGSWKSVQTADEGQLGMLEGETKGQLVRVDYPVVRVRKLDPHTQEPVKPEYAIDFRPGNFPWGPGHPRPRGVFEASFDALTLGLFSKDDGKGELLADTPDDPFKLVVKSFLPASIPAVVHVPDPKGPPMAKIRPTFKGPQMPRAMDVFGQQERWFTTDRKFYRAAKGRSAMSGPLPAQFAFLYVDRPELVEDFLNPPKDAGKEGVARFHYRDLSGKERSHEWRLDGQAGKPLRLPESDLTVTFEDVMDFPLSAAGFDAGLGDSTIPLAQFKVRKGEGEEVPHYGWASLPMFPNVIPNQRDKDGHTQRALVAINYYLPPALDPKTNGRFGVVEVLGTAEGSLYYRVFGRGEQGRGEIRAVGPVTKGKEIVAFGGGPNQPMTIAFEVEEYFPGGREKEICEPVVMPKGKMGDGIGAALVAMTVDDHTEEFWIRRSPTLDPSFQRVTFPGGDYEVAFDVDRKDLGFALKLDDFEVGFDPGTQQASKYVSQVRLNDEAMGIHDKSHTIQMNEPLTHRGYTFFQASYSPDIDPRTGRETGSGRFQSVFQVATDPGRPIKYAGCLLVVFGAFVQFYMRAGIFTDGGKRERVRAAAKAQKRAGAVGQESETTVSIVTESEEAL